LRLVF